MFDGIQPLFELVVVNAYVLIRLILLEFVYFHIDTTFIYGKISAPLYLEDIIYMPALHLLL